MKRLIFRNFLIFILSLTLSTGAAKKGYSINNERISAIDLGEDFNRKTFETLSLMQPRKAKRAQKEQDAKEKKKKKAIKDSSKAAQKRSYEIQSPEVQLRMKQNKKDAAARNKAKKKNNRSKTKKGAKKYK